MLKIPRRDNSAQVQDVDCLTRFNREMNTSLCSMHGSLSMKPARVQPRAQSRGQPHGQPRGQTSGHASQAVQEVNSQSDPNTTRHPL